jgi:hypothetical protein
MAIGTQIAQGNPPSIEIDLSAFVKLNCYRPLTDDLQPKLITHRIYILNLSAQDGALSVGRSR